MNKEVGLIGYGRFGGFAAEHLCKDFRMFAADARNDKRVGRSIHRVSLTEAASKPIVILAVPINQLHTVLARIAPHLQPGTLVIDVSSVKEQPLRWMKAILPKTVSILGTHPLFGPDSASHGLKGHTIVLCPARIRKKQFLHVCGYLRQLGLTVRTMTPLRHDRLMASTLFLTQFIGHGVRSLRLPPPKTSTQNFQLLHQITTATGNDTMELFHDMFEYNRFAKRIPEKLLRAFTQLHNGLTT